MKVHAVSDNFVRFEMSQFWRILAVNQDLDNLEFVSVMEDRNYPFFAVQVFTYMNMLPLSHTS